MNALILAVAYLLSGVALPAASLALLCWLAPKTPGYRRRVFGED